MKIGIDTTFLVEASIREHPGHLAARMEMDKHLAAGDIFFMAPQVIPEFIHVVTDPRRFERPLKMAEALDTAKAWWNAREMHHTLPTQASMDQFYEWMREFNLGKKRLLDTMLAATYFSHDIHTILSSNARDYSVFERFSVITPKGSRKKNIPF
jgi:predicted nucleic acid-binding protein